MPDFITQTDMISRIRQKLEYENSEHVTDAELITYIDEGCKSFYDLVISCGHPEFYRKTYDFNTVGGQSEYSLPDDFYRLLTVSYNYGASWERARLYNMRDIATIKNAEQYGSSDVIWYRLTGHRADGVGVITDTIDLRPAPNTVYPVSIEYVPRWQQITNEAGAVYYGVNGWYQYVQYHAGRQIALKAEEFERVQIYSAMLAEEKQRIQEGAARRGDTIAEVVGLSIDQSGPSIWGAQFFGTVS